MPARTILPALQGEWSLSRDIEGEAEARFHGTASFSPDGSGSLVYAESGWLHLAGQKPLQAMRVYRYAAGSDGSLDIAFADGPSAGALFVRLDFGGKLGEARASATHDCGPDRYDVTFMLALPDRFSSVIAVLGPRKNYRAVSRYRRLQRPTVAPP